LLLAQVEAWGAPISSSPGAERCLQEIRSSVRTCLQWARDNATQVGPLELIQALNAMLDQIDRAEAPAATPTDMLDAAGRLLLLLANVTQTIEDRWFHPAGEG
jgi:hypothetical protein